MHLSEEELLAIAEGERADPHVDECAECARAVAELRAARDALRAAPLLELPRSRVRDLVAALPERSATRRLRGWPRLVAVLAPVAAGAVALAVWAGGDGGPAPTAVQTAAQLEAQADDRAAQAPALEAAPSVLPLRRVRGPAAEVVAQLRERGIEATTDGRTVEVRRASEQEVREALRPRPDGDVAVVVLP